MNVAIRVKKIKMPSTSFNTRRGCSITKWLNRRSRFWGCFYVILCQRYVSKNTYLRLIFINVGVDSSLFLGDGSGVDELNPTCVNFVRSFSNPKCDTHLSFSWRVLPYIQGAPYSCKRGQERSGRKVRHHASNGRSSEWGEIERTEKKKKKVLTVGIYEHAIWIQMPFRVPLLQTHT